MEKRDALYIGGEWVSPLSSAALEIVSPHTEEVIAVVPEAGDEDIDAAVAAASEALGASSWNTTTPGARAEILRRLAQGIRDLSGSFADCITREVGSPTSFSTAVQAGAPAVVLDAYADLCETYAFDELRQGVGSPVMVHKQPVGVCAAIVPWNMPLLIVAFKLGACLASGSTMVIKPAPEAALDSYLLSDLIDSIEGLPRGVVNVVPSGRAGGEYLVGHPGIDKVSFTGSTEVGRRVGAICGERLKRHTLELGGKSAAIILEDTDLAATMPNLVFAALANSGQTCTAQSRVLAPRSRYDEVIEALTGALAAQKVGDPAAPDTTIGPLVSRRQRERVERYVQSGVGEGARLVAGGSRVKGIDHGWYVEPTLFADVDSQMTIAQEEIFGPVVSVLPYDDEDDAVRIANDSRYGLSGSVWTDDVQRGTEIAKRVRTGAYAVNSSMVLDFKNPFGGFKQSGTGREMGREGLEGYLEVQSIILPPETSS